ncbi:unnamed protein product [Closterium sp. NIES-54]
MVHKVLQRFGFPFSSPQRTPLPTGHSLSAPPSDEFVEPNGPYPELVGCLIAKVSGSNPSRTRLFCGNTLLSHAFMACTLASLCLVFPGLYLPSHPPLLHPAFLASRGGSVPLLTPHFSRRLLPYRLSKWTFRLQLRKRFSTDLPVLRLHSDRGGEFSSDLLRDFCRGEGILQSFTLPESPQQNGIAERRVGLVMEVVHTSMIHAAAPHFLWPFADVTFDESVPFYRLFPYCSAPLPPLPLFLAPGPPLVDPLPPQGPAPSGVSHVDPPPGAVPGEVAVDSGAARGTASGGAKPGGAEPRCAEPRGAETGGAGPRGAGPGGAELEGVEPGGAASEGAESGGAEPQGAASSGGSPGALPRLSPQQLREWLVRHARLRSGAGGTRAAGAGGAGVPARADVTGGTAATTPGGAPTQGTGAAGTAGCSGASGARAGGAGVGGSGVVGAGVGGADAGGVGAGGAGAVDPGGTVRPRCYFVHLLQQVLGVPSSTGLPPPLLCPPPDQSQQPLQLLLLTLSSPAVLQSVVSLRLVLSRLFALLVPFLIRVLLLSSARTLWHFVLPLFHCVFLCLLLLSPLFLRSLTLSLTALVLPVPLSLVSSPLLSLTATVESAAASALVAELLDFAAACRLDYATALKAESASASPPSVEGECALGTDVFEDKQEDFECLAAAVPRFASMLLAPEGDPDAPDIPNSRSYAEAITGPYSSQWQAAMDAEMASWKSTGTYVDEVPPPGANIVDGMWIFRVKWPPGSPPAFKALYVARGFSQRQGVDYFQTISPTPKMTTLWVLLHDAAQRDYELHSLDFSTTFPQGSLHEEIWLRRPPGLTGSFPAGTQWSLLRPVYGLRQAPREWHDTLRTTLAALGFAPSTADPSLFLRTETSLPPFYVLVYVDDLVFATADTEALTLDRAQHTSTLTQSHMVHQVLQHFDFQFSSPQPTPLSTSHSLSAPPLDESVEPSGPYLELVGCLITSRMGLVLGGQGPVLLTGHADASWVDDLATQRSSQGYTFSLGSGSVS